LIDWPEEFVDLLVDAGYQVVRLDNRDSGLSTQDSWVPPTQARLIRALLTRRPIKDTGYTVVDMAEDAVGLLDALGVGPAHVVGVSMGGMIVQEMAIRHGSKVRSMCSIMSNTGDRRSGGASIRLMTRLARRPVPTPETAVDDAVSLFGLISGPHFDAEATRLLAKRDMDRSWVPEGAARQMAAIGASRDRTDLLADVIVPTLVVHGLVDPLVKFSGAVATAKAVPAAQLLAFPDMAHDLPEPRWAELRDAIVANCRRAD
jgi:pimeloyl-ACP methyl ester carboxylesterase